MIRTLTIAAFFLAPLCAHAEESVPQIPLKICNNDCFKPLLSVKVLENNEDKEKRNDADYALSVLTKEFCKPTPNIYSKNSITQISLTSIAWLNMALLVACLLAFTSLYSWILFRVARRLYKEWRSGQ